MLAFYARGDALVAVPGQSPFTFKRPPGSPPETYDASIDLGPVKRVGREHVPAVVRVDDKGVPTVVTPARSPATETPWRVDETADPWLARKMAQRVQEKALWPADAHTAEFCGVPFTPVAFHDGEWVEKAKAPTPAPAKPAEKPSSKAAEKAASAE